MNTVHDRAALLAELVRCRAAFEAMAESILRLNAPPFLADSCYRNAARISAALRETGVK